MRGERMGPWAWGLSTDPNLSPRDGDLAEPDCRGQDPGQRQDRGRQGAGARASHGLREPGSNPDARVTSCVAPDRLLPSLGLGSLIDDQRRPSFCRGTPGADPCLWTHVPLCCLPGSCLASCPETTAPPATVFTMCESKCNLLRVLES